MSGMEHFKKCFVPDEKRWRKNRKDLAFLLRYRLLKANIQAARVARAARESGALHPPARLQRAYGVIYTFEPMGKPIGYNPARLQRAYLPLPGIEHFINL